MVAVGGRSRVAGAGLRCVCFGVFVSVCLCVVWCRVMSCVARRCSFFFFVCRSSLVVHCGLSFVVLCSVVPVLLYVVVVSVCVVVVVFEDG